MPVVADDRKGATLKSPTCCNITKFELATAKNNAELEARLADFLSTSEGLLPTTPNISPSNLLE